ncbi:hypothetical protein C789_1572 [Microcystis aeruginosa FACHB-905 = DIANCHI905]|nr:hypothetical protein C789_1572 [Microcystis aeruginosa FACHB-905 = DIANCHI905]
MLGVNISSFSSLFQSLIGFKINWNRPVVKAIRYGVFKVRMRRTRNKSIVQQVTQFFKTPQNLTG